MWEKVVEVRKNNLEMGHSKISKEISSPIKICEDIGSNFQMAAERRRIRVEKNDWKLLTIMLMNAKYKKKNYFSLLLKSKVYSIFILKAKIMYFHKNTCVIHIHMCTYQPKSYICICTSDVIIVYISKWHFNYVRTQDANNKFT